MYEKHFNLVSRPFTLTPYIDHYFPSVSMQKALSNARLSIERGSGPVIVIGDPGTGKSLLLQLLERQFSGQFQIANLVCSKLDKRQELLQNILFELQLPFRNLSEGELRLNLLDFIRANDSAKDGVLLLIDEAHNLTIELLDEVRLMTQIVKNGVSRVPVVMTGNFRLEESLADPRLSSFNQLIATRCYLGNLSAAETAAYVVDHIDRSGGHGKQIFDDPALHQIHELTDGCPRMINQLADHALLLAANHGTMTIGKSWICDAWSDLQNYSNCQNSLLANFNKQLENPSPHDCSVIEFGSLEDENNSHSPNISEPAWEQAFAAEKYVDSFESGELGEPDGVQLESEVHSTNSQSEVAGQEQTNSFDVDPFLQVEDSRGNCRLDEQQDEPWTENQWHSLEGCCPIVEITGQHYEDSDSDIWDSRQQVEPQPSAEPEELAGLEELAEELAGLPESETMRASEETRFSNQFASPNQEWMSAEGASCPNSDEDHEDPIVEEDLTAADPFAENFESVEIIQDRYAPLVAAYNRSSLEITPDELDCLQNAGRESFDENHHQIDTDNPSPRDIHSLGNDLDNPQDNAQENPQQQPGTCQIEQEAEALLQQMYQVLGECSEDSVSSESAQADASTAETYSFSAVSFGNNPCHDNRPDDEFEQLQSIQALVEEQNRFSANAFSQDIEEVNHALQRSPEPGTWSFKSFVPPENLPSDHNLQEVANETFSTTDDDRDIIVCDIPELPFVPVNSSQKPVLFPTTPVSTGRAQRMDYQQLFDQLRNLPRD